MKRYWVLMIVVAVLELASSNPSLATSASAILTVQVIPATTSNTMRAYDFYSKFGVNTDLNAGESVANILPQLQYLGIYNIRDSIFNEGYAAAFATLAAQGVKLHMDFQGWVTPAPSMSDWLSWLKTDLVAPYPGSVVGVSGPNEVDNTGSAFVYAGLNGIAAANKAQQDLYSGIKADPLLTSIPVDMWPLAFAFSGNDAGNLAAIGDQTAYCDRANIHDYYSADNYNQPTSPVNGPIYVALQRYLHNDRGVCNRQNFVTTESGWYTPGATSGQAQDLGTTEYVQARLLLADLFDHASLAYNQAVYIFTLAGGSADSSGPWFGVFRSDGTPKIAATAIQSLMAILGDPSANAATFNPQPFTYSVTGMPSASGNFAIAKGDGSFEIILWNETPIWNVSTQTQITIPTNTVTVLLPTNYTADVYYPVSGASSVATFSNSNSFQVQLNDSPVVIKLR